MRHKYMSSRKTFHLAKTLKVTELMVVVGGGAQFEAYHSNPLPL